MIHLFTHVPVTQKLVRPNQLSVLLRDYQVEGASGVLWLAGPDDSQIVLLLVEGMTIYLAHLTKDSRELLELAELPSLLPNRANVVRTAWLPPEGVRIAKAILDWDPPVESRACETHDVPALLQTWGATSVSSVIRITWTGAEGLVLFTGGPTPTAVLYADGGRVVIGEEGLAALRAHPDVPCRVVWYRAPSLVALPETELAPLRTAFALMLGQLQQSYARLVGVGLVQVLWAELNRKAVGNGWHIQFKLDGVEDRQAFVSLSAAAGVYRQILHEMALHMTMVVGAQMTEELFRESGNALPAETLAVLRQHDVTWKGLAPPMLGER